MEAATKMNRNGHIMWSQFALIIAMGIALVLILRDYGAWNVIVATFWCITVFLNGCTLPDWDHEMVQKKLIFIRWLKYISHHRGHWHSLAAMAIYGAIIAAVMILISVVYWFFPVGAGMFGYLSHLIEDDVNRYKLDSKPKRGLKFW
jgi:membrane-bound metal-dependent hydrolase YbcI (DUF457 family)